MENMKRIFTIATMLCIISAAASAQSIEKLFDKYQDDERFQYIYQKKAGKFDALEDMNEGFTEHTAMVSDGKKMLVINDNKESFADSFTKEVLDAIKADKYENTSLVRTGKNRVEKYFRKTSKGGVEKISFIRNTGNVTLIWYSYMPK